MDIVIKKFMQLVYKRDILLKEHCNNTPWSEICNQPEEIKWYGENIMSLDSKIIKMGNRIILEHKLDCETPKSIHDIYSNQTLNNYVITHQFNNDYGMEK